MASATITDFARSDSHADSPPFSLIEQRGLVSRLIQELEGALGDLARDPRSFVRELFSADRRDSKRRQRIYAGLACAVVAHAALLVLIAMLGWQTMFVKPVEESGPSYEVTPLGPTATDMAEPDLPKGNGKGGGGGGQQSELPPSKGEPPRMLPQAQIVSPNPSNIPEPSLAVLPSVIGPESPPPPPAPIGDTTGKGREFSGGPGSGGGLGRGKGSGIGDGTDGGAASGRRGGKDGGPAGSPDGSGSNTPSAIDFNRIPSFPGYRAWSWIRRQTAIITPEAQENKVIGNVLLRATFNADGSITDIEVVMPVEFMNESAVEALRRSTFRPATINGVPVTVRRVPIKVFVHY